MEQKVVLSNWSAGRPVIILSEETARKLLVNTNDRLIVKKGKKQIIAVIDIMKDVVKKDQVGASNEVTKVLGVKKGNKISISVAKRPESLGLISKKLRCNRLNNNEIKKIIKDITDNALTEAEVAYFVSAIFKCGMTMKETTNLTKAMVSTGVKLKIKGRYVVDKHSIGGVPGRTTPIIVSICAAAGLIMPKTSSRAITSPAGTADAVEVLCNVSFKPKELLKIIHKTGGCIVWGGTLGFAPADDKLIQIEKLINLDPEPQLLASIMSKKIAAGTKYIVIDIPYGKSAKVDKKHALQLKRKFESLAKKLGLKLSCLLSKANEPRGNGFGPILEMIDVISVLKRESSGHLLEETSIKMAGKIIELSGKTKRGKGIKLARDILDSGKAFNKFKEIIKAQGGNIKNFNKLKPGKFCKHIIAKRSFTIKEINIKNLNQVAISAGCPDNKSAGMYLHKHLHHKVKKGDKILSIYSESKRELKEAIEFYEKTKPIK